MFRITRRTRLALPLAVALVLGLSACASEDEDRELAGPIPVTSAPTASPTLPTASATPPPAAQGLVLDGADLGPTSQGQAVATATGALRQELGRPVADDMQVSCVTADTEVEFEGGFTLAGLDGQVTGWVSEDDSLMTSEGIGVGSTRAELLEAYGSSGVEFFPANPDGGPGFVISSLQVLGSFEDLDDTRGIDRLAFGSCTGP